MTSHTTRTPIPTAPIAGPPTPFRSRWPDGLGIVYAIFYAIAFLVLTQNEPGITASPNTVVRYYSDHQASGTVGVFAVILATLAFVFFAGAVRNRIATSHNGTRQLSSVMTTGAAVYASGLLFMAATRTTLLDAAHHHQPAVAQVLNYIDSDNFFPMVIGLSIFMLSTGVSIVRSVALPKWLGWSAVGVGVLAAAGPLGALAFFLAPVWILIASIVLLVAKHGALPNDAGGTDS